MEQVSLKKRTIFYLIGIISFVIGICICVITNIGLSPWDVLSQGLSRQLAIGLGQAGIIISFIVLIAAMFFKIFPGFGTFVNIISIGLLVDYLLPILEKHLILPDNLIVLSIVYIIGVIFMSIGATFYIYGKFGAGPRDSLLLGIIQKTGISVAVIKPIMEGTVLILGIYLGGTYGLGTILNLLLMGIFMDIIFKRIKYDPKVVKQQNLFEQYASFKEAQANKKN